MKCKYCGKEIDNDSVFCEHCGSKIQEEHFVRNVRNDLFVELKRRSLSDLKGNWKDVVFVTLVFGLCFCVACYINLLVERHFPLVSFSKPKEMFLSDCVTSIITLILSLIPIGYSFTLIFLNMIRGIKDCMMNRLFSFFKNYRRSVETVFMVNLYLFLWHLLLIVPGVIKYYAYSMTYYISLDHPEYSVDECIESSKRMMYGHKWELFVLQLSFIGWILLGLVSLGIGLLWVIPYMETTKAHYYERIKLMNENNAHQI